MPALANLDGDGDNDLMVGSYDGVTYGYENTGTSGSPIWTAKPAWNAPDAGDYATPALADLDGDGDFDLLIGAADGVSYGFENGGTVGPSSQIDLTITGLVNTVPADAVFAREPTTITITNIKNQGTDTATNIIVKVYASDVDAGNTPVATATIASLGAGATYSLTGATALADPTIRTAEGTVTYTAKVDPDNLITETNEANNNKVSSSKPVKFNGYKGKRYWDYGTDGIPDDITTKNTFDLNGDIVYYTQPDSAYRGVGWTGRTETWTAANLPIPDGATVEKVLLFFSYNWDQTPGGYPVLTTTFNGNPVSLGTPYRDWSNFGAYPDYEYGLYPAYDVTSMFTKNGDNTLVTAPGTGNKEALYPSTLVVIYSDPTATRKQIFINEEFDYLGVSQASYGTTMEEATAYAPFSGMTIDNANVQSATLHSFATNAGPAEGNVFFNGNSLGNNVFTGSTFSSFAMVFDVKNYLTATGNEAAVQGTESGGMGAIQQVLVVEYVRTVTAPVAAFSGTPTSGTAPLTVTFTDLSTNTPTSWVWDFGDSDNTNATMQNPVHTYAAAGTYTVNLTATNSAGSDSEEKTGYVTVTAGVIPLPGQTLPPTDPDHDGLYEDLNGNGDPDFNDVQIYFREMDWIADNEPVAAFDFNGNSGIDFNDIQILFREM
jgi:PKD repeat protein